MHSKKIIKEGLFLRESYIFPLFHRSNISNNNFFEGLIKHLPRGCVNRHSKRPNNSIDKYAIYHRLLELLFNQCIILREVVNKCFDFDKKSINLLKERCEKAEDRDKTDGLESFEMVVNVINEVEILFEHF